MLFFDFFVRTAQTKEGLERISAWLEGKSVPEGITLDQERRWAAILALARHGFATAPELIRLEASKDPSDLGKRAAYSARVALPLPAAKQHTRARIRPAPLRSRRGASTGSVRHVPSGNPDALRARTAAAA